MKKGEIFSKKYNKYVSLKAYKIDALNMLNSAIDHESLEATTKTIKEIIEFNQKNPLDPIDINQPDEIDSIAIHLASTRNNSKILSLLILNGARVHTLDTYDRTPLHNAVISNMHANISLLIKSGAKKSAEDIFGMRPIMYATNKPEALKTLLVGGSSAKGYNDEVGVFHSPFKSVIKYNNTDCMRLLCKVNSRGLNEVVNKYQMTPLMISLIEGKTAMSAMMLGHPNIDARPVDILGNSILHVAAFNEKNYLLIDVIKRLFKEYDLSIDSRNFDGQTALQIAMKYNNPLASSSLILADVLVNIPPAISIQDQLLEATRSQKPKNKPDYNEHLTITHPRIEELQRQKCHDIKGTPRR